MSETARTSPPPSGAASGPPATWSRSTSPRSPRARPSSTRSTSCSPTRRAPPPTRSTPRSRAARTRAARRRPGRAEGQPLHARHPDHVLVAHPRGLAAAVHRDRRRAPRRAGAIPIGKTNLDEFAMGSSTENSAFGRRATRATRRASPAGRAAARRPRSPRGSRRSRSAPTPAARSASPRRCAASSASSPRTGACRATASSRSRALDQIGPFANDVDDAALLLETIAGHDPSTPRRSPDLAPVAPLIGDGVAGLRVGIVEELTDVDGIAARGARRGRARGRRLEAAGATVERVSVPSAAYGLSAYYLIAPAEASSNLARYDGVRYGLRVDGDDVAT